MVGTFDSWIGKRVTYVSGSGRTYSALVTGLPENPHHGYSDLPGVLLEFRNERGKLVRKHAIPEGHSFTTQVWRPS